MIYCSSSAHITQLTIITIKTAIVQMFSYQNNRVNNWNVAP